MTLFFLTILTIIFIAYPLAQWSDKRKEACFDYESDDESSEQYPFLFLPDKGEFHLCEHGVSRLKGDLGKFHSYIKEERVNVYTYSNATVLNITRQTDNCLRMEWTGISSVESPLIDCFVMKDDDLYSLEWFGAHELYHQSWPLTDININMTSFLPQDYLAESFITYQSRNTFGPVLHPLWLASNGVGILVDQDTPLSVSIKQSDGQLCLQAVPYALECIPNSFEVTKLHYTICIHSTVGDMARYFLSKSLPHPRDVPSKEIFKNPIWSTKNLFTSNIDNQTIKNYLGNITHHYQLGISQLELHDGYGGQDGSYGDLSMDIDAQSLVDEFDVSLTAWVHPFVNPTAEAFTKNVDKDFFLPGKSKIEGDSVSVVKWWHEYGAVINFLDETVRDKHRQALVDFKNEYGLISLLFDAGEVTYLPKCVYTRGVEDPGEFTTAYSAFVGNFSGVSSRANVRVGYFSQTEPVCVRMLDRMSTWSVENGLKSVITTALTFGIGGYPFVVGDVIGGNGETPYNFDQLLTPDPVLYIRWMQLSTFLPVMQFSVPPFQYGDDVDGVNVVEHAKALIELHQSLSDVMYDLSLAAMQNGYPIIRPIWWIDDCYDALFIDDQFLIGDDIMIAPMVDESNSRCVYFPPNTRWHRNGTHGDDTTTYPNGCSDDGCDNSCMFQVELSEFLYFTKV